MAKINILDANTIDKIAAGEVVERPSSVVKELVENAIDAGATIITVEIKNGGIKLIRVSDNGSGIESDQVRNAFYPHATSKILNADDLNHLYTLGFRGEALSSISAVSRTEVTTRTDDSLTGIHCCYEGGIETTYEEVGAPTGTTFIVRDLFYNTLPRLKFLKSETSEGNMVADLMEHLALSMPHISFNFISNGSTKFTTSGRGDLREVIYRIYGKEIANNLIPIDYSNELLSMKISGFLGRPNINRSNRANEIFFINHRYVKSVLISKAVEEGCVEYLMQHKFPFCVLNMEFDPYSIDVNVHPTKTEVRLSNEALVAQSIVEGVSSTLMKYEMIDSCIFEEKKASDSKISSPKEEKLPEVFEHNRLAESSTPITIVSRQNNITEDETEAVIEDDFFIDNTKTEEQEASLDATTFELQTHQVETPTYVATESNIKYEQASLFDTDKLFTSETRKLYRVIGQLFKTYWLIEYEDKLLIMDQHAAHEKVRFERLMKYINEKKDIPSQNIAPAEVMTLNNREMQVLFENIDRFNELGFTIEEFGEREIAIRAIPLDLYGVSCKDMVGEILTDLLEMKRSETPDTIRSRIATMACKSAIKGNNKISLQEIEALLDEMLLLDNPYNCPHGRPTMISMTENELEKRFHRIV